MSATDKLPGHVFDGLFNARMLAALKAAINMAEQSYRPSPDDDIVPEIREAILEASEALNVLKSRLLNWPLGDGEVWNEAAGRDKTR